MVKMLDRRPSKRGVQTTVAFFLFILVALATITRWINLSITADSIQKKFLVLGPPQRHTYSPEFNCSLRCSDISTLTNISIYDTLPSETCPEYFRWIHEDLRPWKDTGITKEMVEEAKEYANIHIVIVDGRMYTKKYVKVFQTRDAVTIWGILQLLRLYPGKIPDMELIFECGDKPVVAKWNYGSRTPPPVFHYCGDAWTFDIVFPDWSFWGWPELNIKPWETLKEDMKEGNRRIKWVDREPYAYWKGNPKLSIARRDLVKCNNSEWHSQIDGVDWMHEKKHGFETADLSSQCTHRYKIYVEGIAWSVSEKYILTCDSMALLIDPHYYDFYTRSLLPTIDYWPINEKNKCQSIKFAVEWGNKHMKEARRIGRTGSKFMQENLKMKYVYDYMFHLLNEYAKLLRYKPTVPEGEVEMCSESSVCSVKGSKKRFRIHSMVKNTADSPPCALPSPYSPAELENFLERKRNLTEQVRKLEESHSIGKAVMKI